MVAVDSRDRVVLAYSAELPGSVYEGVFVQRWEQGAWTVLGTALGSERTWRFGTGAVESLSLLSWMAEEDSGQKVYIARFGQGAWSAGTEAGMGNDPVPTFTPEGVPMLWVNTGQGRYDMFLEH